jgi:hypothetical protein
MWLVLNVPKKTTISMFRELSMHKRSGSSTFAREKASVAFRSNILYHFFALCDKIGTILDDSFKACSSSLPSTVYHSMNDHRQTQTVPPSRERHFVTALHLCQGHRQPMTSVRVVEAIPQRGLRDDMHAIEGSTRQVLLMDEETLRAFQLEPGRIKENITTHGVPLMSLRRGQRLRLGQAVLQLTSPCKPCERMDELRPGLSAALVGKRGMLARVIEGGMIHVGDTITLLPSTT